MMFPWRVSELKMNDYKVRLVCIKTLNREKMSKGTLAYTGIEL